eukprot:11680616-Karenia_brevis.AAC.1
MVRRKEEESAAESDRSVRKHADPSLAARRKRMNMRENKFDTSEEEEDLRPRERVHREESSSSCTPPSRVAHKEEPKEEMDIDHREL